MARKEILICDNCKQEHNELTNPVRHHCVDRYFVDLCEECYNKIGKIDKKFEKELNKVREQYKVELKTEAEEIYKIMFPEEYKNKEVDKDE